MFASFQVGNDGVVEALKVDLLFSSPGGLFTRVAPEQPPAIKLP